MRLNWFGSSPRPLALNDAGGCVDILVCGGGAGICATERYGFPNPRTRRFSSAVDKTPTIRGVVFVSPILEQ
jgi:hypothetical protein